MFTKLYVRLLDDDGAVALEYGALVVGIIALLAAGALFFGGELEAFFRGLMPL
jgi:Flp pilus assembly pilin Flp